MRKLRTIRDVEIKGKRVLVRIDCNVATDEDGHPVPGGEQRLRAILPTLAYLRDNGARSILLSHLGRPGGRVLEALRLDDVAARLSVLVASPVRYVPDVRGPKVREAVFALGDSDFVLLENLRFDPGEEAADQDFAKALADLGELFVNDAFSVSHRNHASVAVLPELLPAYAGLLLTRETEVLGRVLHHPERPVVAVLGGAKLETKLALLKNLLPRVDRLLTGGGVANTFLRLADVAVGASLAGADIREEARSLLAAHREKIVLPHDVRVARGGDLSRALVVPATAVTAADEILDLGPATAVAYCQVLAAARTCVWNGPLGKFELPPFREATRAVAACVRGADTFAVVGGGDTVRALTELQMLSHFDHVSTGGGAMLAFLEEAPMPGLEPLYESQKAKGKGQNLA